MRSARKFALALKTFWAPLNFPLILEFLKVGNVQQNNDISSFNSFLGQIFTDTVEPYFSGSFGQQNFFRYSEDFR